MRSARVDDATAISGVYVTNSKAAKVIEQLTQLAPAATVVGYDLIEDNVRHLRDGRLTYLIHQNPFKMAYQGMAYLVDHLIFKKEIPSVNLLPLDVVTKENVDSYLSNQSRM